MDRIDIKGEVAKAVGMEWATFAARHPHLAAAMDQDLLVEQAMASLEDDPAYQSAMEKAAVAGVAAESISAVVKRFVGGFFGKLLDGI